MARPVIEDNRPMCACGRRPKRSSNVRGKQRYYCPHCKRYISEKVVSPVPEFKPACGLENFALYALTGHFPRVTA